MSRPLAADSSHTHGRILAAMRELLNELGATSVSLRAVAKRANISLGTLSYYFPTREALVAAALDAKCEVFQQIIDGFVAALASQQPIDQVLPAYIERLYLEGRRHRGLIMLRLQQLAVGGGDQRDPVNGQLAGALATWGIAQGAPSQRAWLTVRTMIGMMTQHIVAGSQEVAQYLEAFQGASTAAQEQIVAEHLAQLCLLLMQDLARSAALPGGLAAELAARPALAATHGAQDAA